METEGDLEDALQLLRAADHTAAFAIGAVATLGIVEYFQAGPRPATAVAAETGLDGRLLRGVLRVLAARGLFSEPEHGVFQMNRAAQLLLDSHEYSLRHAYALMPADVRAWTCLRESLHTGESAYRYAYGMSLWEYLSANEAAGAA